MSDTVGQPSSPKIDQLVKPKGFQNIPDMRWKDLVSKWTLLLGPLHYISLDGEELTVPAGVETDYASIPQVFWNIMPPIDNVRFPAILHDYLYSCLGGAPYYKSRAESDALFLEAMMLVNVGWIKRHTIYQAVRLFGWKYSGKWDTKGAPKAEQNA